MGIFSISWREQGVDWVLYLIHTGTLRYVFSFLLCLSAAVLHSKTVGQGGISVRRHREAQKER